MAADSTTAGPLGCLRQRPAPALRLRPRVDQRRHPLPRRLVRPAADAAADAAAEGDDSGRAAREGTITDVRANEGEQVTKGAALFVIRSQAVGDRAPEMRDLEMQRGGADQRLANAQAERASQRRAD